MRCQIVFLDQHNARPTPRRIARNTGTIDAAANHQNVIGLCAHKALMSQLSGDKSGKCQGE